MTHSMNTDVVDEKGSIKTGRELTDDFFHGLSQLGVVDEEMTQIIQDLYSTDQLTADAVGKALADMRGKHDAEG